MKYLTLTLLALLAIACAVIEGLVEDLPAQFIQINGLLTLVSTGLFLVAWVTIVSTESPSVE